MLSGIHPTALIGELPQMRDARKEDGRGHYADPGVIVAATALVGAYTCIDAGFERPTIVGARSWVMKQVHIGHDTQIGEDCEIASGAVLGGHVTIGDRCKLGLGCVVRPKVKIGNDVRIGAGAVIIRDVPDGVTVVGNPGRILIESAIRMPDGRTALEHRADERADLPDPRLGYEEATRAAFGRPAVGWAGHDGQWHRTRAELGEHKGVNG